MAFPHALIMVLLALASASFLASTLGCMAPQRTNGVEVTRRGDDVLAVGDTPRVTDSVPGDAMLAGGDMSFSGATGGDYLGAGGSQLITGRIHGSARAAGGNIRLTATVARNATIAGGNIVIDSSAVVERNAYIAGGTVIVNGTVRQSLQLSGGTLVINGAVDGNVDVGGGELRVGPRAVIGGNLRYQVPAQRVRIDSAARIGGTVTAIPVPNWRGALRFFRSLWLLGFLVAGLVAVALAPRLATEAAGLVRGRPGLSVLVGIVWVIVVPIVVVLVAMTVIGVPLALLTGATYAVFVYLGRVVLAVWLGRLVLSTRVSAGRMGAIVSFLAGGIILVLAALLPVVGSLVQIVACVFGVGALLIAIRDWARAPGTPRLGESALP
jgi:cytoskeletal protein CcmA (bactofilin family)